MAAFANLVATISFDVKRKASVRAAALATDVLFKCNGRLMWLCVVSIFVDVLSKSVTAPSISFNFLGRRSSLGGSMPSRCG